MLAQPMECPPPPPAAQKYFIEKHIESGTPFDVLVLQSADPQATLEVNSPAGPIPNPLAIAYSGKIVDYAGRIDRGSKSHVEMVAANQATVEGYIGNRALRPAQLKPEIVERTVRAVRDLGLGAVGFTDGHKTYGAIP